MGILKNGLNGHISGMIDGLVYFTRMGKNVTRTQNPVTAERSPAQKANSQRMQVTSHFLTPVLEFTNQGFKTYNAEKGNTAYNRAVSEIKLNGLKGVYPDVTLNYEALRLSKGKLPIALDVSLAIVETGLEFKWAVDPKELWPNTTDQAMLLVYFPETNKALYVLYGTERASGLAVLPVSKPMLGMEMHCYISFIAADRNDVSDCVYAGALNL